MAFDIKIYGEIVPFQDKWISEQGGYANLTVVQEQLALANGQDVRVRINSCGGDVDEGFAIYSELRRYAKDNNAKITTLAEGTCASIATVIFLAGDSRITTEYTSPFVHNAWSYVMGDSRTLSRIAADLEYCNKMIAQHYAKHTDLTYEEARELMDNDTYISPEECLKLRFSTGIEEVIRPVALQRVLNSKNNNQMPKTKRVATSNNTKNSVIKKFIEFFNKDVFTADNQLLEFPDLEDNDAVKVGDKANLDGKPADGEVIIANGDVYVFANGELLEIRESDHTTEDKKAEETPSGEPDKTKLLEEENLKLKDRISELEKEVKDLEDLLEKSKAKIDSQTKAIKAFKDIESKFASDEKKENKGNGQEGKPSLSDAVTKFKENKLKK